MDTSLLSDIWFTNISQSVDCLFIFLILSYTAPKILILVKSNLLFFYFFTFGVISKKPLPKLQLLRLTSLFSSKSFLNVVFTFKFMIHFEFIFVYGIRQMSRFTILHVDVSLSGTTCLKGYFFLPLNCLGTIVKNKFAINVRVYFWTLNSIPLIHMLSFC